MKLSLSFAVTALAALLTAVSCSVDERVAIPPDEDLSVSTVISPDEALDNLDALLVDIYGHTKSGAPSYDPESLSVFGGAVTKSSEGALPDTSVYIVNFTDESGFAILAAQRAMSTPVFCVTEAGTLTSEDLYQALQRLDEASEYSLLTRSSEDPSEEMTISAGEDFVPMLLVSSIVCQIMKSNNEPINPDPDTDPDDEDTSDEDDGGHGGFNPGTHYETLVKIGPLLETKWHQGSPFNDFRSDNASLTGVAVATAQILAYNEYGNPDNKNFNWNLLKTVCHYTNLNGGSTTTKSLASSFMEYVGAYDNCRIKYDPDGSSASSDGAKRTFDNFGYKNVRKRLGFENADKNNVVDMMTVKLPVYISGQKGSIAHAWVIDGLFTRNEVLNSTGDIVATQKFFHLNWGFQGISDGYYAQGVFNTTERESKDPEVDSNSNVSTFSFTWNYRTITYSLY